MAIMQRGSSTGSVSVDKEIDRIYRFLINLQTSTVSNSSAANTEIIYTDIGGIAVKVQNGGGELIPAGYMLCPAGDSSVKIAVEGTRDICGVCYKDIAPYGFGYMVVIGWCVVYFNANGATVGNYFRISKANDTVNNDKGKANSTLISSIDTWMFQGYVFQTITGEGLAKCCLKSK